MTTAISFLVFCQALGAATGAFTAVWAELAYLRAKRDGQVDAAERAHLDIIARGLRFGMTLLLLASLGLVIVAYILQSTTQPALTPAYWTLIAVALVIVGVSWAISRRHFPFSLGSAIIFTSWWFLAYFTLGLLSPISFGSSVAFLIIATAIVYAAISYLRFLAERSVQTLDKK
ncbi:MAG: hypothetical protein AAB555_03110 [Patescibacteria group bacterium]